METTRRSKRVAVMLPVDNDEPWLGATAFLSAIRLRRV